jgi:hypothetical protein
MKRYRVKVTEHHSDYVWVNASSEKDAERKAPKFASCEYELLYDSKATGETEVIK